MIKQLKVFLSTLLTMSIAASAVISVNAANVSSTVGTIDFNDWSNSTYYATSWRVNGFSSNTIPSYYTTSKKFGADTPSLKLQFNSPSAYGYINKAEVIDLINIDTASDGYRIIEFDMAAESLTSNMQFAFQGEKDTSGNTGFLSLSNGKVTIFGGGTLINEITPKKWYNIKIVEKYIADGTKYSVAYYVNNVKSAEKNNVVTTNYCEPQSIRFTSQSSGNNEDNAFYLDNVSIKKYDSNPEGDISDNRPNITTDYTVSGDIIEVPSDMMADELVNSVSATGYTFSVVDENSNGISGIAEGNYLVASSETERYVYLIKKQTPITNELSNGKITFDNYTGPYSDTQWRVYKNGSSNPSDFAEAYKNEVKFGAETKSFFLGNADGVSVQYGGRYSSVTNGSPFTNVELTNVFKYRTIQFDFAAESLKSNFDSKVKSGSSWMNLFTVNNGSVEFNGTVLGNIEAQKWYTIKFYEIFTEGSSTAKWNVYVNGYLALENVDAAIAQTISEVRFNYSENTDKYYDGTYKANGMYLDNINVIASNEPQQLAEEGALNPFVQVSSETLNDNFDNQKRGFLGLYYDGERNVTSGFEAGLYGKSGDDYASVYRTGDGGLTESTGNSAWLYAVGTTRDKMASNDTYTIEFSFAAEGEFSDLSYMMKFDNTGYFPIQFSYNKVRSFGEIVNAKAYTEQWNRVAITVYPKEYKIETYLNDVLIGTSEFGNTSDLTKMNDMRFFMSASEGNSFKWAIDDFEYYHGEKRTEELTPSLEFINVTPKSNGEVVLTPEETAAFTVSDVTALNHSKCNIYRDSENVQTIAVAAGDGKTFSYYKLTELSPITVDETGTASVKYVSSSNYARAPKLFVAAYNADGVLKSVSYCEESSNGIYTATTAKENGDKLEVFLWDMNNDAMTALSPKS